MDGSRNIIDEVKKSMGLKTSQGFTKGISSHDICKFLRELTGEYRALGRNISYKWKKLEGGRDKKSKGFSGIHVQRIMKRKQGNFIIFGQAAWNNVPRAVMKRQLEQAKSQNEKFAVYGKKANGMAVADHALSLCIGDEGKFMYDNAFLNVRKAFKIETLALYMRDICYGYVFDICECV
jgi:hypothetical protein